MKALKLTMPVKWPVDTAGARKLQAELSKKVRITPLRKRPGYVAGVDAAFFDERVVAVACLYGYPDEPLEDTHVIKKLSFPYITGFLTFREGPAIIEALRGLKIKPDLILFDGQGIAHPKGVGIASHIGVLLDIPAIGCAKSRLVGTYREPGRKRGNRAELKYDNKTVGAVLRTREGIKPLFISPGHRIDLKGSIDVVLECTGRFRIPEPLRRADRISKRLKKALSAATGIRLRNKRRNPKSLP